ncbi:MAG TPA: ClpXP protease specificity-enhancing factor SspB [Aliidongia sp.]|nr:ClpXP protease specificity-enhancing factor SspB [Aliidongia sp.]
MAKPTLRYDKMVESALRSVVRDALAITAERGLPGGHHFYVTFRTDHPGVDIPDFLRAQYPHEMTIVLEHQFWGLEVDTEKFAVTLSFHSQAQRLIVPLAAITAFADPSVKFGLEFRPETAEEPEAASAKPVAALVEVPAKPDADKVEPPPGDKSGEVVKLDTFRKK